jgi:hypothetical protein
VAAGDGQGSPEQRSGDRRPGEREGSFLRHGDLVEVEIDGPDTLVNPVRAE